MLLETVALVFIVRTSIAGVRPPVLRGSHCLKLEVCARATSLVLTVHAFSHLLRYDRNVEEPLEGRLLGAILDAGQQKAHFFGLLLDAVVCRPLRGGSLTHGVVSSAVRMILGGRGGGSADCAGEDIVLGAVGCGEFFGPALLGQVLLGAHRKVDHLQCKREWALPVSAGPYFSLCVNYKPYFNAK